MSCTRLNWNLYGSLNHNNVIEMNSFFFVALTSIGHSKCIPSFCPSNIFIAESVQPLEYLCWNHNAKQFTLAQWTGYQENHTIEVTDKKRRKNFSFHKGIISGELSTNHKRRWRPNQICKTQKYCEKGK